MVSDFIDYHNYHVPVFHVTAEVIEIKVKEKQDVLFEPLQQVVLEIFVRVLNNFVGVDNEGVSTIYHVHFPNELTINSDCKVISNDSLFLDPSSN